MTSRKHVRPVGGRLFLSAQIDGKRTMDCNGISFLFIFLLKATLHTVLRYHFPHNKYTGTRSVTLTLRLLNIGPVRIRVRIDPPHPFVCRKRRLNGAVLRMKNRGPVPQQVWHDKDPSLLKGPERRA
jgi:hypothetical protein